MKIYADLDIYGTNEQLLNFIDQAASGGDQKWKRDPKAEKELNRIAGKNRYFCFSYLERGVTQATLYFVHYIEDEKLRAVNLVPDSTVRSGLGEDEYKAILDDFSSTFRDVGGRTGVRLVVGSAELSIENVLSPRSVRLLRQFSTLANKSTGSSHPLDRKRWYEFILAAHKEKSDLDATTLSRWLFEEEEWPDEEASNLAIEYEFARGLLDASLGAD